MIVPFVFRLFRHCEPGAKQSFMPILIGMTMYKNIACLYRLTSPPNPRSYKGRGMDFLRGTESLFNALLMPYEQPIHSHRWKESFKRGVVPLVSILPLLTGKGVKGMGIVSHEYWNLFYSDGY